MTICLLALYLLGGMAAGMLYFGSLWWNAGLFERAGRVRTLIASMAIRFVLLGGVLAAVSMAGAMPLLVTTAGVLLARFAVLRHVRIAMP